MLCEPVKLNTKSALATTFVYTSDLSALSMEEAREALKPCPGSASQGSRTDRSHKRCVWRVIPVSDRSICR